MTQIVVAKIVAVFQKIHGACKVGRLLLRLPVAPLLVYDRTLVLIGRTLADVAETLRKIKRHQWGVRDAAIELRVAARTKAEQRRLATRRHHAVQSELERRKRLRRAADRVAA